MSLSGCARRRISDSSCANSRTNLGVSPATPVSTCGEHVGLLPLDASLAMLKFGESTGGGGLKHCSPPATSRKPNRSGRLAAFTAAKTCEHTQGVGHHAVFALYRQHHKKRRRIERAWVAALVTSANVRSTTSSPWTVSNSSPATSPACLEAREPARTLLTTTASVLPGSPEYMQQRSHQTKQSQAAKKQGWHTAHPPIAPSQSGGTTLPLYRSGRTETSAKTMPSGPGRSKLNTGIQGAVLQPSPLWYGLAPFGLTSGTSGHLASGLYTDCAAFAAVKLQVAQRWRSDRQPQVTLAGPRSTLPLACCKLLCGCLPKQWCWASASRVAWPPIDTSPLTASVGHQHHSRLRSC